MSMPTKGKHHLQQSHHSHQQSHIVGANQSTASTISHSQHYNSAILNNSSRFVTHPGSDFHVPGQNFGAQPGGQVGGGGGSIGVSGGRRTPLGNIQSVGQNTSGIPPGVVASGQAQAIQGSVIPPQSQGPAVTTATLHNPSSQEMGKQTHLQQPPMQQVYAQNQNRSSQPNYYSTGPRPQQSRNLSHRGTQPGNQSQVVGMSGVGASSGQPTAIYPHPSIAMPTTLYVQGQVSGLHNNPHQQNVYPMNNQMPMQYSGPPQRHQTHQNQFPYQSYQTHALLATPNLFGYTHGTQHPGFFYHQQPNAQLNLSRASANTVGSTQHLSGSLTNASGATIVSQTTLQQQTQQPQTMHTMNITLPQADVYSGFNGGIGNVSTRFKKPRTKAITDIVNPNTGKNISDEIYKDEVNMQNRDTSSRESPQSADSSAVVADFAARVAKLASEEENQQHSNNIKFRLVDCPKHSRYNNDSSSPDDSSPTRTFDIRDSTIFSKDSKSIHPDDATAGASSPNILENILIDKSTSICADIDNTQMICQTENKISADVKNEQVIEEDKSTLNIKTDDLLIDTCYIEKHHTDKINEIVSSSSTLPIFPSQHFADDASLKPNGEPTVFKNLELESQKYDLHQKPVDGKNMQKQKNKNKIKNRELSRKGAEKEGTDLDAFVNSTQVCSTLTKIEMEQDIDLEKNINKDENVELTKDNKEKDNYESRKEKDNSQIHNQTIEKNISALVDPKEKLSLTEKEFSQKNRNNKDANLEKALAISAVITDDVEHIAVYRTNLDKELVPPMVAQKNEENSKVSGLSNMYKEGEAGSSSVNLIMTSTTTKATPSLKYIYSDDQWSPINTKGKKIYGREFLMKLQNDPNSKIKPSNLPDLDVVLKDNIKSRSPVDLRFKDANLGRHESLFPGFLKSSLSTKVPPPSKKSHSGKPKASKPNVIHVSLSLREDVKLRETENAWKPTRLVQSSVSEEQTKTEALYKRVRSVLNKLTPQKFDTLVNQVRELQIDTQERLQGVIDLVFEKAVDEPNFSVAYALMCRELSDKVVTGADPADSSSANFRKLIVTRCQTEFEKNTVDENARLVKLREIDECTDPERKKELLMNLEEEERRLRIKSVGNIRFIGELFKQNMLSCKIMHQCIRHLLEQVDEENLECLCKLLTTIGKALESKNIDLSDYFKQMQQIANRKGKISSRIRFMLQDVIDLRGNKWIPRRDDSNPKTMDQIQREAESERLDIQFNNAPLNTPRKDERINERKRNRGGSGSIEDGDWSHVGRTRQVYSVETAKLKNKPPSMDDMLLGSRSNYQWSKPSPKVTTPNKFSFLETIASEPEKRVPSIHLSGSRSTGPRDYGRSEYKSTYDGRNSRNGSYQLTSSSYNRDSPAIESSRSQSLSLMTSSKSSSQTDSVTTVQQLSENELEISLNKFLEEYVVGEEDVKEAVKVFPKIFPGSHSTVVHEILNAALEKSDNHRNKTSLLLAQLLSHECISLLHFKKGLQGIIEAAGDLIIDIPKLWKYFAKILVHPVVNGSYSLSDLKDTMQHLAANLRSDGHAAELMAELLSELIDVKDAMWVATNWSESDLQWTDLVDDRLKINQIVTEYNLDFLTVESSGKLAKDCVGVLNMEKIHDKLLVLLKDSNYDEIYHWIKENVGENGVKEPKFIRALMTAMLETSIEMCDDKWAFKVESFDKSQKLIQRFVDADEYLELQCLFAVQAYVTKLSHPAGLVVKIMTYLCENNVVSNEAFLTWETNQDPAEREGKSVALVCLKSFFTPLKEGDDMSSCDES